ncbi:MAG TPA: 4-alpha-glucanotransferase, partial [Anseongella sp.]|nr:4-alpha-glucanotransferase [Anseongella sp.]
EGQLWGMPVFRWNVLKEQGYAWWVQRIRRNMEWYDLLRLDHFRAFSAYWEVPGDSETAARGRWMPGPGAHFFRALEKEFGVLPFVAEDLGDIDEAVYQLRDRFRLPGMKVLQFAFGKDMAQSVHAPHQYTPEFVVYTGTHDNNTTRGWYERELDRESRRRLSAYAGRAAGPENVHRVLGRLAYASVARTVILPMQDALGLDERSRMNIPASAHNNWLWRLRPGQATAQLEQQLLQWVKLYGRS